MRLLPALPRLTAAIPLVHRRRHVWVGGGHVHLEARDLDPERLAVFAEQAVAALAVEPGVQWAELNAGMHRVVVARTGDDPSADRLAAVIDRVEAELGVDDEPFRHDLPDHPGDDEVLLRQVLTLGGDLTGLGIGLARRLVRVPKQAVTADVAALLGVLQNVPQFRRTVEQRVGWPLADVGLEIANAVASGLAQGPLGPFVDLVHRGATVAETVAKRTAWSAREPELCAEPATGSALVGQPPTLPDRPVPVPPGPVERCAERAWPVSLGAFAVALPLTRSLERATAALSAGLPKAARLGRESFAVHLGRGLADRGVITLEPRALRLLDRIDTVVVEAELLARESEPLAAAVERAGLRLCVAGDAAGLEARLGPHEPVPTGAELAGEIRARQAQGAVVLVLGASETAGLAAADCAVGVPLPGTPIPWSAHVLCRTPIPDAVLLVDACAAAREASRQSATIALAGASVGGMMAFGGLPPGMSMRVTTAVNLATLVAVANGTRAAIGVLRRPEPVPADDTPWHAIGRDEVLTRLGTSRDGLDGETAASRRVEPPRQDSTPVRVAKAVGEELVNPLTPILAVGAGLSVAVGSVLDAAMVTGVVGLNALVGGVQRSRVEQAVAALEASTVQHVLVRRAGREVRVTAADLVPGDLLHLEAGEAVPADCRIIEATSVEVDESSLTGESLPVVKSAARTSAAVVAERSSMVYEGTSLAAGSCWAAVVAVGQATEARRALAMGRSRGPQGGVEARLRSLTDLTVPVAAGAGVGIIGLGLLRGHRLLDVASAGVSLTVAAVPEGLPLLATVAQLSAARRLSSRGALVRNPRAIEALGRVDVLCADKTGTLTEGRIRVGRVSDGVEDTGLDDLGPSGRAVLAAALRATPRSTNGRRLPHPTDRAVLHAEEDTGVGPDDGAEAWAPEAQLAFEPGRGYHAVLGRHGTTRLLCVKGAPEVLLRACTSATLPDGRSRRLDPAGRARLAAEVERLGRRGYRVLLVAERAVPESFELADRSVRSLRFRGLLCLTDPVRPTAAAAVASLRRAGITVAMITGDHPSTAEGIAADLGLLDGERVLTGPELDELSDAELDEIAGRVAVFARVTPSHKVRIVRAYQRAGRVVAMTGDGANDAPAIRLADVGIALGTRSTAAARDAADVVVTDDRIETIVDAIVEGRGMWGSVREAVAMLVGSNLGEIAFTVAGSVIGGVPPLNARQLLLVNLLTDVAPAMAVAVRPPRGVSPDALLLEGPDASLGESLNRAIALRAAVTGASATAAWLGARVTGTPARARTVGLVALVGTQLGQTVAAGGRDPVVLAAGLGSAAVLAAVVQTPGVSQLFGCQPIGPFGWLLASTAAGAGTAAAVLAPRALPALGGTP